VNSVLSCGCRWTLCGSSCFSTSWQALALHPCYLWKARDCADCPSCSRSVTGRLCCVASTVGPLFQDVTFHGISIQVAKYRNFDLWVA